MKLNSLEIQLKAAFVICAFGLPLTLAVGPSFLRFGFCSKVPQKPDFDLEKFTGTWYGILRVPNEYSPLKRCITSNYSSVDESGRFINSRSGVADNGTEIFSDMELMTVDDELHSYAIPAKADRPQVGITVVETDYTNFACFYSCVQRFTFKAEFVGLMSRTPTVKKAYVEQCKEIITGESAFDWSHLTMVEHGESCPYWSDHLENVAKEKEVDLSKFLAELAEAVDHKVAAAIDKDMEETNDMEDLLIFDPYNSAVNNAGTDVRVLLAVFLAANSYFILYT